MNKDDINTPNVTKQKQKGWLQRLKEESWEAELLVSAIAIYGSFQLFGMIDWATNTLIDVLDPSQYLAGYVIVFLGLFAISILTSMFVVHFFLRAYWIGLVGLNSVFPDYSIEDSAYSKIYTEKLLTILPKPEDSIKKVDELCSVIFSVAFTFLLIYTYIAIFASVYLLLFNLLSSYVSSIILLIPLAIFCLFIFCQMIVALIANLKANKEKEKLQTLNFKVVKYGSILMYGPLYKAILQIMTLFGSNFKKKKSMVYLLFSFLIFGLLLTVYQMNKTNIPYLITTGMSLEADATRVNSSYYESENDNNTFLLTPEIKSDIIKNEVVKIFIPIFDFEEDLRVNVCGNYIKDNNKSKVEQRKARRLFLLNCYNTYNTVYLNDIKVDLSFLKYDHPRTNQFGVVGYVSTTGIKQGMNQITVKKEYDESNITTWSIPFYYIKKY